MEFNKLMSKAGVNVFARVIGQEDKKSHPKGAIICTVMIVNNHYCLIKTDPQCAR